MPMLMTAAGTVKAARVLILGVGVAGLQAIATAKRLGAVIEASDVRPAVKEQIESLGAKFIDVPLRNRRGTRSRGQASAATRGRCRRAGSRARRRRCTSARKQADIVITTALIPGRPAPTLIVGETVKHMKPGSVIVDLAAGRGPSTKAGAATAR